MSLGSSLVSFEQHESSEVIGADVGTMLKTLISKMHPKSLNKIVSRNIKVEKRSTPKLIHYLLKYVCIMN